MLIYKRNSSGISKFGRGTTRILWRDAPATLYKAPPPTPEQAFAGSPQPAPPAFALN
jgi:hypothetical protein